MILSVVSLFSNFRFCFLQRLQLVQQLCFGQPVATKPRERQTESCRQLSRANSFFLVLIGGGARKASIWVHGFQSRWVVGWRAVDSEQPFFMFVGPGLLGRCQEGMKGPFSLPKITILRAGVGGKRDG